MKLKSISCQNYRSLRRAKIEIDDYTALVGANGSGKSTVLYALDWFFEGGPLSELDISMGSVEEELSPVVSVTVEFDSLTEWDRSQLGPYGYAETAILSRVWSTGEVKSKLVGRAMRGPGFVEVLSQSKVGEMRTAYKNLDLVDLQELEGLFSKSDVEQAFAKWESDPTNRDKLVALEGSEMSHMFGINGENILRKCIHWVFVPAAVDFKNQLGEISRGNTMGNAMSAVLSSHAQAATERWVSEHDSELSEFREAVLLEVDSAAQAQGDIVSRSLSEILPGALVEFAVSVPAVLPKLDASIETSIVLDGRRSDVSRHGHGVQRSVMIAFLRALDELSGRGSSVSADDESAPAGIFPVTVIGIEEPELYQHPTRARSLARILGDLANGPQFQVLLATHSPYFVGPERFESIRRFTLNDSETSITSVSVSEIVADYGVKPEVLTKYIEKEVPAKFAEGFFADRVILVEGDTDRVVIESLADLGGAPLDILGVAVVEVGGKNNLATPYAILKGLGIPVTVVVDGDANGADRVSRKNDEDEEAFLNRKDQVRRSHKQATGRLVDWLVDTCGLEDLRGHKFGDASVTVAQCTIWQDDLEAELEQWNEFVCELHANGGRLRTKNALQYKAASRSVQVSTAPVAILRMLSQVVEQRAN